jgi:radical SAM superfamily enzyme YgiQ (UPF0313 family)
MSNGTQRVLFTSPVQPIGGCSANVYCWDKPPGWVRLVIAFLNHPGLCFLKANVPCDILEYPSGDQFAAALADPPDVLGISFYINETEIALRMVEQARRAGVREVWAGNFGAYSPQIQGAFDRVFRGWGESDVALALGLPPIPRDGLRHPEMYTVFGTNLHPRMFLSGILFTARGCPWTCNFCQTPTFYGGAWQIPLEAVERTVWTYRRHGVDTVNILDESFGAFPAHAHEVVEILHRHRMRWIALTRVDTLSRNLDDWCARGMFGAHLGVESLSQNALRAASKRIDQSESVSLLRRMSRRHMVVQAFYIIGFETDTAESIRGDVEALAELDIDIIHVQILTPYPQTGQRELIEGRYGIRDRNLSKYNSRNLVWNHPRIGPEEMRSLQRWAHDRLTSSGRALRAVAKYLLSGGQQRLGFGSWRHLARAFSGPSRALRAAYASRLTAARRWMRVGWRPYDEVEQARSATAGFGGELDRLAGISLDRQSPRG